MTLQKHFRPFVVVLTSFFALSLVLSFRHPTYANDENATDDSQRPEAVLQVGHRRAIHALAFSPDGRWLATGGKDNTIKIWEVASGRLLRTLYGHGSPVNALSVSPDGKLLASGSGKTYDVRFAKLFFQGGQVGGTTEDTTVRVWDVVSGRQLQVLRGHSLAVMAVAFSADGRALTSTSADAITVWEIPSGKQIRSMGVFPKPKGPSFASNFKPGIVGASRSKGPQGLVVWEKTFKDLASQMRISGNGQTVAAALPGKKFRLFDAVRMKKQQELDVIEAPDVPGSLAFSGDGQLVVYVRNDREIAVQRAGANKDLWHSPISGQGHSAFVCFTSDGREVAAETIEGNQRLIHRWAGLTGKPLGEIHIADSRSSGLLAFNPSGRLLAMSARGSHSLELRDITSGQLARRLGSSEAGRANGHDQELRAQLVKLGVTQEGELNEAEEEVSDFSKYHAGEAITFVPDSRWLLTKRGRLAEVSTAVWDTSTGTAVASAGNQQWDKFGNPDESPDGRFRVVPEYANDTKSTFLSITSFHRYTDPTSQGVKLLDARDAHKLHTFKVGREREAGGVPASGFSLDGSRIAVTGFRGRKYEPQIFVFETGSGKKVTEFPSPEDGAQGPVTALAMSRDTRTLAMGFRDQGLQVVDATTGSFQLRIPHVGGTAALSFNPDGRFLALLGQDGDAYLFDAHTGQMQATLVNADNGDWLVVTPDGKFDGSPEGWNQILWRFGGDTFNVAPVETFFNEFYYPGLLADIIAGKKLRTTRDFAQLDRRQPSLELAVDGASDAAVNNRTIHARLKVAEAKSDKGHPQGSTVRDVRLFRNGSLVATWRGEIDLDAQGQAVLEATVPIVVGPNRLTAYAFNEDNIKSPDASLVVTGGAALKHSGVAYVLSVGINEYSNPDYSLKFAVADAQDVSTELKTQQAKVGAVGKVEVVPLLNTEATKKNILLALRRLAGTEPGELPAGAPAALQKLQPAQPEDEVFIYFAGHGVATDLRFYVIPYDLGYAGNRNELDQAGLLSIMDHSISDLELEDALEKVDARDVILVIDACNSGQALEAEERRRGPMNSRGLAQLAYEKGMYVLTAAQGYQAALEVKELGHGLLTFALVEEGLKTPAADRAPKDGKVVAREWMDYAAMRVPELQEAQIDAAQKQGRDLTFVEVAEDTRGPSKIAGLQRPRVFYRREADPEPLVVAKP
jgi:WD40 repeat protein